MNFKTVCIQSSDVFKALGEIQHTGNYVLTISQFHKKARSDEPMIHGGETLQSLNLTIKPNVSTETKQ